MRYASENLLSSISLPTSSFDFLLFIVYLPLFPTWFDVSVPTVYIPIVGMSSHFLLLAMTSHIVLVTSYYCYHFRRFPFPAFFLQRVSSSYLPLHAIGSYIALLACNFSRFPISYFPLPNFLEFPLPTSHLPLFTSCL